MLSTAKNCSRLGVHPLVAVPEVVGSSGKAQLAYPLPSSAECGLDTIYGHDTETLSDRHVQWPDGVYLAHALLLYDSRPWKTNWAQEQLPTVVPRTCNEAQISILAAGLSRLCPCHYCNRATLCVREALRRAGFSAGIHTSARPLAPPPRDTERNGSGAPSGLSRPRLKILL